MVAIPIYYSKSLKEGHELSKILKFKNSIDHSNWIVFLFKKVLRNITDKWVIVESKVPYLSVPEVYVLYVIFIKVCGEGMALGVVDVLINYDFYEVFIKIVIVFFLQEVDIYMYI